MTSFANKKWILAVLLGVGVIAGFTWWKTAKKELDNLVVSDYTPDRDRAFILNIFKNNWYWLISSPDYSAEHMLDTRSSSKSPENLGNLTLKTLLVNGNPVGFSAYFMKEFFEGYILFLAVDEQYRGKGFARTLLAHAMDDLTKRGAIVLRLVTRLDNTRGRKLYRGMGFNEIWNDATHIKFEKKVK